MSNKKTIISILTKRDYTLSNKDKTMCDTYKKELEINGKVYTHTFNVEVNKAWLYSSINDGKRAMTWTMIDTEFEKLNKDICSWLDELISEHVVALEDKSNSKGNV